MKISMMRSMAALVLFFCGALQAAAAPDLRALSAADDERVAAILTADKARLTAIFSDDLRYAHSTGVVDNKTSYTDAIASGKLKYLKYEWVERVFTIAAPGIALMTGRADIKATMNGVDNDSRLSVLAVWREEQGKWRFLAWQSAKMPPAAAPVTK